MVECSAVAILTFLIILSYIAQVKSDRAMEHVYELKRYIQYVGLLFFVAHLQLVFAMVHEYRALADQQCMGIQHNSKHVCVQHTKQAVVLIALGGHIFQTCFECRKKKKAL